MATSKLDTKSILIGVLSLICLYLILNRPDRLTTSDAGSAGGESVAANESSVATVSEVQHPELDAFWEESARTVREGDFDGYAASFHEDAVLVNGIRGTSYPIAQALAGWKQGFDDTRDGKMNASVEFRFSERLISENTAHETGIFRYTSQMEGEEESVALIHFESLAVKKDGRWQVVMEYQVAQASEEEWEALAL